MTEKVTIVEVGPRDGLQAVGQLKSWLLRDFNMAAPLKEWPDDFDGRLSAYVDFRVELIRKLAVAGLKIIEAGSFVHPRHVPLMMATDQVLAKLEDLEGIRLPVLTPNRKGYHNAWDAGAKEVAFFLSASEGYSQKNTGVNVEHSFIRFDKLVEENAGRLPVRGYLSCIDGYRVKGDVPLADVIKYTQNLLEGGCYEVSLGSTFGYAEPGDIRRMMEAFARAGVPPSTLAAHFHDNRDGGGLENIKAFLKAGGRVVDSAISYRGGEVHYRLGGAVTQDNSPGNSSTQEVVELCHDMGFETDVDDIAALDEVGRYVYSFIERPPALQREPTPSGPDGSAL